MKKKMPVHCLMITLIFSLALGCSSGNSSSSSAGEPGSAGLDSEFLFARGGNGRRCEETAEAWQNVRFRKEASGVFTIQFNATFNGDPAGADAVAGIGDKAGFDYKNFALLVRFFNGVIQARNGNQYVGNIPFAPNQTYGIELSGNVADETYSVRVNGQTLGSGLAFRSDYTGQLKLAALGLRQTAQSDSLTVCDWSLATDGNQLPLADAGGDQTKEDTDENGSEAVTLDGSGSSDPDGTIVSYAWFEGAQLLATGKTAQVTLPLGLHTITLKVEDDDGASATDAVTVNIKQPGGGGNGNTDHLWAGFDERCGGFPIYQNVGPYDTSNLIPIDGSITLYEGQMLKNAYVNGTVSVIGNNVEIENVIIDAGGGYYGIRTDLDLNKDPAKYLWKNIKIRYVEIINADSTGMLLGGQGDGYGAGTLVSHAHVHKMGGDAFKASSNVLVQCSLSYDLGLNDGSHADTFQIQAGENSAYEYNACFMPFYDTTAYAEGYPPFNAPMNGSKANACVIAQAQYGPQIGLRIVNNFLFGNGYSIRIAADKYGNGHMPKDWVIENNLFGPNFGSALISTDGNNQGTISGNLCEYLGVEPQNNRCPCPAGDDCGKIDCTGETEDCWN